MKFGQVSKSGNLEKTGIYRDLLHVQNKEYSWKTGMYSALKSKNISRRVRHVETPERIL